MKNLTHLTCIFSVVLCLILQSFHAKSQDILPNKLQNKSQNISHNKEELAIRTILQTQTQAWNNGSLEKFMSGYWQSDSLKFIGKNGITYGWQATLDNYKKSYPDKAAMGILTFEIITVEISGKTAFVIGKWKLTRQHDEPKGYYTLFWKKIKGKWQIVADHSS
jgi:ketosteroid isomerase-like protein